MIICFTGTGNSRMVADYLQDLLGDNIVRFAPGLMIDPKKINSHIVDERVIWVFPVHSWGVPDIIERLIVKSNLVPTVKPIHHMVCTCGDDIGMTEKQWRRLIENHGGKTGCAFSIQMPNSYTCMKGFDVDKEDVAKRKLDAMPERVKQIAEYIESGRTDVVDVVRGRFPRIKSYVIRPWFNRIFTRTKPFHTTDACTGCGMCMRNCSIKAIDIENRRPVWVRDKCIMCLRCYHICPRHAIQYGRATEGKGQYLAPGYLECRLVK